MTGQNPFTTGCYRESMHFVAKPQLVDLPAWFQSSGYLTVGGGKLYHHMPGFIDMRGWDEFFHWNPEQKLHGWGLFAWDRPAPQPAEVPSSPVTKELWRRLIERNAKSAAGRPLAHMDFAPLPNNLEEKMADTICANWGAKFLRRSHDRPFFLGVGFYAPHKPNFVPHKYFDLYKLSEIELPPWKANDLADLPPELRAKIERRRARDHALITQMKYGKRTMRGYLAALSYCDAMVGRLLDALDAGPNADNTIVVLWSDNGYHHGEKGCWAKHTLWERTSNVPFIWAGPGIARGEVVEETVSLLDTYPTLVELCRLPDNPDVEGVSLAPVLKNPASAVDRTVLQTDDHNIAAINRQWRYTLYENGEQELYDQVNDPNEWYNLAGDPKYAATIEEMRKHIPAKLAPPAVDRKELRLVTEGETFRWVPKLPKPNP